ncbi:hypothetical protein GSY69_08670 [Brevibacterium sp. 5221]|uniref:Tetratricopeptide repeat protein n=1 Tax=Brevibacterium rongguiense TaxID=2695267 RepID=A0A6N9H914_9MICO|nr:MULTISPECIES: hypothetical protein [Brevibacterium]MYM20034.1 hypothetical protein [Brevibacterium rongguiense]WAL41237.1 hypothetical protein BRM1_05150 [Brevibacterium sp. BRM-1]
MSKAKLGAVIISVLLALYLVFTAQRGWIMITEPNPVAKVLGIALFALPILGAWALIREFAFGARMERLGRRLGAEGGLPPDDLPRTPGGRIVRSAADAAFAQYRDEAEAAPDDWRSWFRLSCAYDVAGDRKRARATMRRAIAMEKAQR